MTIHANSCVCHVWLELDGDAYKTGLGGLFTQRISFRFIKIALFRGWQDATLAAATSRGYGIETYQRTGARKAGRDHDGSSIRWDSTSKS